jgi:hypothetical protein
MKKLTIKQQIKDLQVQELKELIEFIFEVISEKTISNYLNALAQVRKKSFDEKQVG